MDSHTCFDLDYPDFCANKDPHSADNYYDTSVANRYTPSIEDGDTEIADYLNDFFVTLNRAR